MQFKIFVVFLLICLSASCRSSYKATSPYGVDVKIILNSANKISGELLFLDDDTLYAYASYQVYAIQLIKIHQITGIGLDNKSRGAILIFSGLIGAALITQVDDLRLTIPVGGLSVWAIFEGSKGVNRSNIKEPFTDYQKKRIRSFCRYPQGLTKEQYVFLLGEYTLNKPIIVIE